MSDSPTSVTSRSSLASDRPQADAVGAILAGLELRDVAPVRVRELAVIGLLVVVFDLVVYRGHGYAGAALGFIVAPLLLWAGAPDRASRSPLASASLLVVLGLLIALAIRMVWLGTAAQVVAGLALIAAFAMSLTGRAPFVLDTLLLAWQLTFAGALRLPTYAALRRPTRPGWPSGLWLRVLMPAAVVLVFGVVFVQANPDLRSAIEQWLDTAWQRIDEWFENLLPSLPQVVCWCVVAWLSIGLLRPIRFPRVLGWLGPIIDGRPATDGTRVEAPLLPAFRNTLLAVISLFAVYLVFEFRTLWFREFPQGFYYAGYAHEGAAWLTVALALATLILSAIFRGAVLSDVRLPGMKRLAWVWSGFNLLLAAAVYHRLQIYVDFNGMTRMRTVGIVGVTTVLAGFLLVVWKIARDHGFLWLIERQLWALVIGLYVLAVLPMDALIQRYNVARILSGDPAPAVQITEHDVDVSGLAALTPLLDAPDEVIRAGITARLANEWFTRETAREQHTPHWTEFQQAEANFAAQLQSLAPRFDARHSPSDRNAAWERFREYAYQWY